MTPRSIHLSFSKHTFVSHINLSQPPSPNKAAFFSLPGFIFENWLNEKNEDHLKGFIRRRHLFLSILGSPFARLHHGGTPFQCLSLQNGKGKNNAKHLELSWVPMREHRVQDHINHKCSSALISFRSFSGARCLWGVFPFSAASENKRHHRVSTVYFSQKRKLVPRSIFFSYPFQRPL